MNKYDRADSSQQSLTDLLSKQLTNLRQKIVQNELSVQNTSHKGIQERTSAASTQYTASDVPNATNLKGCSTGTDKNDGGAAFHQA